MTYWPILANKKERGGANDGAIEFGKIREAIFGHFRHFWNFFGHFWNFFDNRQQDIKI